MGTGIAGVGEAVHTQKHKYWSHVYGSAPVGEALKHECEHGQARAVLDALLAKYQDEGVINLDDLNVLRIPPLSAMGSVVQLVNEFGGKAGFEQAVHEMQAAPYKESA